MDRTSTALFALACLAGCGGGEKTTAGPEPAQEKMPLPPPSATAVGFLLTHSTELHLSAEQTDALRGLEKKLAGQNQPLQEQLDALRAPERKAGGERARRGAGGRGGMGGGGMGSGRRGGGVGRGGMQRGGGSGRPGAQRPSGDPPPAMAAGPHRGSAAVRGLRAEMAVNHDRVAAEALCVLESEQRAGAEKLLADEGYEPAAAVPCD